MKAKAKVEAKVGCRRALCIGYIVHISIYIYFRVYVSDVERVYTQGSIGEKKGEETTTKIKELQRSRKRRESIYIGYIHNLYISVCV